MDSIDVAFKHISERRDRPWANEEEVRLAWVSGLEKAMGVHLNAERAREDSSYNNLIIEFKAPGLFRGTTSSPKFKEATENRLLPYILRKAEKSGIPAEDYIGIAIDGDHICFAQVHGKSIQFQHLVPFSKYAVALVIAAITADTRRAITIENLIADFGHRSLAAKSLMQSMSDALAVELAAPSNSKIKMLFEEWRTLYGQAADMSVLQADAIAQEIGFVWSGTYDKAMPGRLFVIHTYNSLLIKLLAAEVVSAHGLTSTEQPAQAMAALLDDSALINALDSDIEHADIFTQAGINGFVEEAIFSWYLDIARDKNHSLALLPALRNILASLSMYRTDHMNHTRDVLRDFYQDLVPRRLRQSLGEFYTSDWLVDFTIDKTAQKKWIDKRVLDPTCGSGAFLVAIIRRIRKEAENAGWSSEKTLLHLCEAVWGFDLNPLAVQTARVNFLLEIADLLKESPGISLEVPILLADAIYSPAPNPDDGEDIVTYQIGSQVAGLDINLPSKLAFDRLRLDQVFVSMGDSVNSNLDYKLAEKNLLASKLLNAAEAKEWRPPLKHTYDQILTLHRQNWNGIWFRIVRNFFWSATAGEFDCIIGNPPWVRWSKLPDTYRERVKPTCEQYGIFSKTKRHGGNELDISAMITYTTADKWLKVGGRLAFVITGTVFKNPSSAGFRHFQLNKPGSKNMYLSPISVDDMKDIKPFSDASNHTTVAIFNKSKKITSYPIPYSLWSNAPGSTKNIPTNLPLPSVKKRVVVTEKEAFPVGEIGSPWSVLKKGRFKALKLLGGKCAWAAGRKGITTDLNGVYFVPELQHNNKLIQVRSRPEAGRKDIGATRTAWVEPDLLYPLIKGAKDFEPYYLRLKSPDIDKEKEVLYTFVPNTGIDKADYAESESNMNSPALKKTKAWFSSYEEVLEKRSTYRRQMKGAPFYGVYNVGEYTFQPWKVIWPEMSSNFYAAVAGSAEVPLIGKRPYIPDHKIYYVAFDNKKEAYFLCGILNTSMVREWIESHTVKIQVGDVFKHMSLPEYDQSNKKHKQISKLVESIHKEHNPEKRIPLIKKAGKLGEDILIAWLPTRK